MDWSNATLFVAIDACSSVRMDAAEKNLSVERLFYLAKHSSRRLIRAIQAECLQKQPHLCFGRHMVLQLLGRDPNCRGILVDKRRKRFLVRLTRKMSTQKKLWQRKMSASEKRTRKNNSQLRACCACGLMPAVFLHVEVGFCRTDKSVNLSANQSPRTLYLTFRSTHLISHLNIGSSPSSHQSQISNIYLCIYICLNPS